MSGECGSGTEWDAELWKDLSKKLEMAASDLEAGNVEAAGSELRNAAWRINRELDTGTDRSGGER